MDEYRDGLLLFDLMEKEIWEKSKTDTIGLAAFFTANNTKYLWKNRVDAWVISSTSEAMVKAAQKMLKKGNTIEEIKTKLNTDGKINVMAATGVYEEGSDSFPKAAKREVGVGDVLKEGAYFFATKVNKVLPAGPKTLEEAKGKAINDYQQFLESNWVADLKKEFEVKVSQDVFENVKKQL
jgi:peptidyl-prolyl cis-trans isomerase SurA